MIRQLLEWTYQAGGAATASRMAMVDGAPDDATIARCHAREIGLWLDVTDPSIDDEAWLHRAFGFHPLATEDALKAEQRPKIDEYPGHLFLVFYAVHCAPSSEVTSRQIGIFVGPSYIVTVHHGPAPELTEISQRWERAHRDLGPTVGAVLYILLDHLVDGYFPVVDELVDRIEALEEAILDGPSRAELGRLFALKRNLLRLRRLLGPQRDVLNLLIRRDAPIIDEPTGLYFQDVYDHVLRVTDTVDLYRDLLTGALDVYLTVTSNNLNQVMKRMTAISTILMSLALIAGIYGMNFDAMPELKWTFGYTYALGLMAALGAGLTIFFRRIGWF